MYAQRATGRRPWPAPPRRSAGGLVDRVLVLGEVVLSDDHRAGGDLRLGRVAVEGGDGLLHALRADVGGLLGDQRLDRAGLEVLDLLRASVEADDLDVLVAGLAQTRRGAFGSEQVGGEDALQVRRLGQL